MSQPTHDDWQAIGEALRAPFPPQDVEWRVQGKVSEHNNKVQVVAYVDARAVADRLDTVVGPGAWAFTWEVIAQDPKGDVTLARGSLTIHGVTKQDVGDASSFAVTKGCVSDALKRAAVLWGIGRYLYEVESPWITPEGNNPKFPRISANDRKRLQSLLPRPGQAVAPRTESRFVETPVEDASEAAAQPVRAAARPEPRGSDPVAVPHASAPTYRDDSAVLPQQLAAIGQLCDKIGRKRPNPPGTFGEAKTLIAQLSEEYSSARANAKA